MQWFLSRHPDGEQSNGILQMFLIPFSPSRDLLVPARVTWNRNGCDTKDVLPGRVPIMETHKSCFYAVEIELVLINVFKILIVSLIPSLTQGTIKV